MTNYYLIMLGNLFAAIAFWLCYQHYQVEWCFGSCIGELLGIALVSYIVSGMRTRYRQ